MNETQLRELDAFLAEHVMGWRRTYKPDDWTDTDETLFWHRPQSETQKGKIVVGTAYHPYGSFQFDHSWKTFAPTTDPSAALMVQEKCAAKWIICVTLWNDEWHIWDVDNIYKSQSKTLPVAICEFARKAFDKKGAA